MPIPEPPREIDTSTPHSAGVGQFLDIGSGLPTAGADPARIVATLMDALPSGSYLIASHGSPEYVPDEVEQGITRAYTTGGMNVTVRDHSQFADIALSGLELVPPGLLVISEWRPEPAVGPRPQPWEVSVNGAVARKP